MREMTKEEREEFEKITYGVRENTVIGSFVIASGLPRAEAMALLKKLEKEAKENGTYFEDRYVLTYRRP